MTMPPVDANGVRDFTIKRPPHQFRIDDDVFAAPAIISPIALKKISALHSQMGDITPERTSELIDLVAEMFIILLPGASGRRFADRLKSEDEPIDLTGQAIPIIYWLLEQYGLRPTEPSSLSETGSTESETATPSDGDSSTDGVSPMETGTT